MVTGNIKFSMLKPGTHIPPHCGPSNYRIRLHLGLFVPDGTWIRVGNSTLAWEDGRAIVFDGESIPFIYLVTPISA